MCTLNFLLLKQNLELKQGDCFLDEQEKEDLVFGYKLEPAPGETHKTLQFYTVRENLGRCFYSDEMQSLKAVSFVERPINDNPPDIDLPIILTYTGDGGNYLKKTTMRQVNKELFDISLTWSPDIETITELEKEYYAHLKSSRKATLNAEKLGMKAVKHNDGLKALSSNDIDWWEFDDRHDGIEIDAVLIRTNTNERLLFFKKEDGAPVKPKFLMPTEEKAAEFYIVLKNKDQGKSTFTKKMKELSEPLIIGMLYRDSHNVDCEVIGFDRVNHLVIGKPVGKEDGELSTAKQSECNHFLTDQDKAKIERQKEQRKALVKLFNSSNKLGMSGMIQEAQDAGLIPDKGD